MRAPARAPSRARASVRASAAGVLAAGLLFVAACGAARPAPHAARTTAPTGQPVDRFADLRRARGEIEPAAPGAPGEPPGEPPGEMPGEAQGEARGRAPVEATPEGAARSPRPGAVGHVDVELPLGRRVHVRATLPVPDGFALPPRADGAPDTTPLALELPSGALVPCQVEPLTRGPDGAPEVVEVIAPLELSAAQVRARTGATVARLSLPLHRGEFELPAALAPDADVGRLLTQGPLTLRAFDCVGNEYRGELLRPVGHRVLAWGPYLRRVDVAAVMRPVPREGDGAALALPHLFGLHGHLALFAGDPRVGLDLRVHAGLTSGAAPDTPDDAPVGAIWFRSLELELPPGWTCDAQFPDAAFGPERVEDGVVRRVVVAPLEGNFQHLVPPAFQFQRRLVVRPRHAPAGVPHWEALGFAHPDPDAWSWHNPALARYFPQRAVLPTWEALDGVRSGGLDGLRRWLTERRDGLLATLRTGGVDGERVHLPARGWFHPWFYAYQGATGGADVVFVEGHLGAASSTRADLEYLAVAHQMNVCRQSVAQWLADGRPAGVEAWRDAQGRIPFPFYMDARHAPPELKLPCLGGEAPAAHLEAVRQHGRRPPWDLGEPFRREGALPREERAIVTWMPHDAQHLVRFTKNAKALAWLAADRLAMADLRLEAERFRLMVHDAPPEGSYGASLGHLAARAADQPHTGLPIDRAHAWGLDAVVAAYALGDDTYRAGVRPWIERYVDVVQAGTMPNGLVSRVHYEGVLGGRFDGAQSVQMSFLLHSQRALVEGVLAGVDEARAGALREGLLSAADYLYFGPPWQGVTDAWSRTDRLSGPANQFAVAPRGADGGPSRELPYCYVERWGEGYLPPGGLDTRLIDTEYPWDCFVYAEQWARDLGRADAARYLDRALALGRGAAEHRQVVGRLRAEDGRNGLAGSGNHAVYLARVQRAGRR